MGRLQPDPSPSNFQPASEPQPHEYHYEQQVTDEIPPPVYESYNDENHPYDSSYPAPATDPQQPPQQQQQPPQPQQPPQSYPPQQPPQQYPPQQPPQQYPPRTYPPPSGGKPQAYPPQAEQAAVQFPPPHSEKAYQPSEPAAVQFPPPQQQGYQAPGPAAQFPPRSPFFGAQQPQMNYGGMGAPPASGVPVMNNQFSKMGTEGWSTDLFGCMENPENALITAIFPCLTFGQIAEIVDNGHTSCGTSGILYGCIAFLIAMPCLISCTYRTKMRSKFGLVESPAPDWATHCLCECCALCQEYRELQHRGYDPAIGWMGNMHMQQQQIGMVPPTNQTMMG
ncbi:Protein PLANT CADMIUM RESISTANCE like [Actinidia chinensis var. chinensis]|uniref:Protein PLANT CADMIUM RESISTANCE like n=1 Tax=Actinidia chinensis var. chinensis TaxID=1590841 RepID=A0A2R6QIE9_ACTCC|nr:Protein PLANT CADMIUM RESISTANCE like [Actinidia chinensis var. chinensis]